MNARPSKEHEAEYDRLKWAMIQAREKGDEKATEKATQAFIAFAEKSGHVNEPPHDLR